MKTLSIFRGLSAHDLDTCVRDAPWIDDRGAGFKGEQRSIGLLERAAFDYVDDLFSGVDVPGDCRTRRYLEEVHDDVHFLPSQIAFAQFDFD
jgi:hypothetical protein